MSYFTKLWIILLRVTGDNLQKMRQKTKYEQKDIIQIEQKACCEACVLVAVVVFE